MIILGHKFKVIRYGDKLPAGGGVYVIMINSNDKRKIYYVGKTKCFQKRVGSHNKLKEIKAILQNGDFIEIGCLVHRLSYVIERLLIRKKNPLFNTHKAKTFLPTQYIQILQVGKDSLLDEYKNEAKRVNNGILI